MGKFYSDELEQGILLLYFQPDTSKYAEGVKLIEQAVAKDEPDAYYFLARCYAWGDGNVKDDDKKALSLSKRGIELGSDLCVLGADRFDGLHGELEAAMHHSLADSFEAVKRKAESGDPMAQYAVGLFYYWQDITSLQKPKSKAEYDKNEIKNGKESHKWFRMAARCGCIPAYQNVYRSLAYGGNGIAKDPQAAFSFAEEAKDYVKLSGENCRSLVSDYEEIKNYGRMRAWAEMGAATGCPKCTNDLGRIYLYAWGVPEDDKRAFDYFCKADELGNEYGSYNVARCLYNGWGTPVDKAKAFVYFKKASEKDHSYAQVYLAEYYLEGKYGVAQDYTECRRWAEKAAGQGRAKAKYYLGRCYYEGVGGVIKNPTLALRYLNECVESETKFGDAYRYIGIISDKELDSPEQAAINFEKAIANGCEEAKNDLARFKKTLFGKWKRR